MSANNTLTLYQREECPFCQVVRKKLAALDLPVLLIPVAKNGNDRKTLIEKSGQKAVPVLADGDKIISDSSKILAYLDEKYGSGTPEPLKASNYGMKIKLKGSYAEIKEKTVAALATEGFGVLTEIDVKATLKKKLGVDVPGQVILGACNPKIAHQALQAEADLGLLLPCNVVIKEESENEYWVTAVNPLKLLSVVGRDDLLPVAGEVRKKFNNVLKSLEQGS